MRVSGTIVTGVLLLFHLFTAPSTAEIQSLTIRSDDRPMILFQKFGFTNSGTITVTVSAVSVSSAVSQPDPSRLGFFLLSDELLLQVLLELQQNPNFCVVDSKFISLLFTFRDLPPPPQSSYNKSFPVTYSGEYSLFFVNCNPESLVTMDVRTELYNIDEEATNIYLSVGLTQLPSLYFIFSIIYLCFLGFWISVCFKKQQSVHRIHLLMLVLLITKTISLIFAAIDKHYVKVTGTHYQWNALFYMFSFINVVLLFVVIVLIGVQWSYLKPILLKKEKVVLMIVITLQVLANVPSMVIGEIGPYNYHWVSWNQVFLLLDFITCCAVIAPIVWSIRSSSKTVGNLAAVGRFGVAVIGYLLFTRVGVFAMKVVADYKNLWVSIAAEEVASVMFYLVVFYMFRPVEEDEYSIVGDDCGEYEAAAEMVKG